MTDQTPAAPLSVLKPGAIPVAPGPFTLAIDIGGSHVKASVLDRDGTLIAREVRVLTPRPATPRAVLQAIAGLVAELPPYDRISAGFPGYIRRGRVATAPNLGTKAWAGFRLDQGLQKRLKKPARVLNDADVQGLGAISGHGVEVVLTLGTGIGSALFHDGALMPHLELGQHPIAKGKTYDGYLGNAALKHKGPKRWNHRLKKAIEIVRTLTNFDTLHLGGGNVRLIDFHLPPHVKRAANIEGITGGVRLWDRSFDAFFAEPRRRKRR